jgi:putative phage-type endonuclease
VTSEQQRTNFADSPTMRAALDETFGNDIVDAEIHDATCEEGGPCEVCRPVGARVEKPTGVLVPRIEPGTAEWLQRMSASKIAAVVGLSQWESRFSLYHRMAGTIPPEPDDDMKRRGHYLEPAIAAWFADQHPDCRIEETGTYIHAERDWQSASPDRLVIHPSGHVELLQCKSAAEFEEWGDAGTDEIPVGYRAQVLWEMDTAGVSTCHVAAILPYLEFRAYVVHYNAEEAAFLRQEGRKFLDELEAGQLPAIDGHDATYQAVREMHPDIEPDRVEIPARIALPYLHSLAAEKAAKTEKQRCSALVVDAMGNAKDALYLDARIASRQAKNTEGSIPYLVAARGVADQFTSEAVA